jgi:2-oxo-4-hydroxy-4-carboxy-5-ureidoimidazoline decarboxylase
MTIAEFDHLDPKAKETLLLQCCGSTAWARKMLAMPPAEDLIDLFEDAEEKWYACTEGEWKEAFARHPKIGDLEGLKNKFSGDRFAGNEQASAANAPEKTLQALAEGNLAYEKKFGYIFIVCASGLSADEMLHRLQMRLSNDPAEEIRIAMEEQNKITRLRLEKLFLQ